MGRVSSTVCCTVCVQCFQMSSIRCCCVAVGTGEVLLGVTMSERCASVEQTGQKTGWSGVSGVKTSEHLGLGQRCVVVGEERGVEGTERGERGSAVCAGEEGVDMNNATSSSSSGALGPAVSWTSSSTSGAAVLVACAETGACKGTCSGTGWR